MAMQQRWGARRLTLLLAALGGSLGCSGRDSGLGSSSTNGSVAAPLRRLTHVQYANSVHDIFGANVIVADDPTPDPTVNGFASAAVATDTIPGVEVTQFATTAESISRYVTSANNRVALCEQAAFSCDANASPNVTGLLTYYGKRLFRRPLVSSEVQRYSTLAAAASDPWTGMQSALSAMLQSPYFLFRIDWLASPGGQLDAYSISTRLSFVVLNSAPDDTLLAAAASGSLLTPAGLSAATDHVLQMPGARAGILNFFSEWLDVGGIAAVQKDPNTFPKFSTQMLGDMQQQVMLTIGQVVLDQNSDFRDILTTQQSFTSAQLSQYYGFPAPDVAGSSGLAPMTLPSTYRGVLTLPGLMALNAKPLQTSPTERGRYILETFLCEAIPNPPPNVNTTLAQNSNGMTLRQVLAVHRADPACASCHNLMDPPGLVLEAYDSTGAYRTSDNGQPLDLSGQLLNVQVSGPAALVQAVHDSPQLVPCVVTDFLLYATGDVTLAQGPVGQQLATAFANGGYTFMSLIRAYVQSSSFGQTGTP